MIPRRTTLTATLALGATAIVVTTQASVRGLDSVWECWRLPAWIAAAASLGGHIAAVHRAEAEAAGEREGREIADALVYLDDYRARG